MMAMVSDELHLPDGRHRVTSVHGHGERWRWIEVRNGVVLVDQFSFTQDDFFKVNRLVDLNTQESP
jgi:hypothetical protein